MKQRLKGLLALVLSLVMVLGLMTCAWGVEYYHYSGKLYLDESQSAEKDNETPIFAGDVIYAVAISGGQFVLSSDKNGTALFTPTGGTGTVYDDYGASVIIDGSSLKYIDKNFSYTVPANAAGYNGYKVFTGERTDYHAETGYNLNYLFFEPIPITYTVRFDKNAEDATGRMADQIFEDGVEQELSRNIFTREGYDFKGWKDDAGVSYADGAEITVTSDITLYAQWEEETVTCTVTFNKNSEKATGTMTDLVAAEGDKVTLTKNDFERDGYTFAGWNTKADGTGDAYADEAEITVDENITLYAQWTENSIGEDPEPEPPVNPGMPYFPPKKPEVESANTFDGGIASAVVVTILSATGSAWLAKKKD